MRNHLFIHWIYLNTYLFVYLELSNNSDEPTKLVNSISDGILEVFGIVSSFHIAQLQVGISKPVRIGQAKHVKVFIFLWSQPVWFISKISFIIQ